MQGARPHIAALDGLRGIAAWLVVLSHTNNLLPQPLLVLSGAGAAGVMIFFVLSGFLMGLLYASVPPEPPAIADFVVARIARVFPLYFAVVLFSFVVNEKFPFLMPYVHVYNVTIKNIWEHVFFIRGQSVLWTIPVEVTFYSLFVLLWLVRGRSRAAYLMSIAALWLAVVATMYKPLPWGNDLPRYVAFFFSGLVIAEVYRAAPPEDDGVASVFGATLVVAGIILLIPGNYRALFGTGLGSWSGQASLLMATTVCAAACYSSLAQKVLGARLLSLQGDISYSVYLLHPLVLHAIRKNTGLDGLALFPAVIVGTLVIALASYHFIERPCRSAIRSLRK